MMMQEQFNAKIETFAALNKVIIPVARRVFPGLIAHELIDVEVVDSNIPAKKISARWSFEATQDAEATFGKEQPVDIEAEIMAALAQEINAEYDQSLFQDFKKMADVTETYTYDHEDKTTAKTLVDKILLAAKDISANRIIISPIAFTILKEGNVNLSSSNKFHFMTKYVGKIDDMKVYVDQFASDHEPIILLKHENGNSAGVLKLNSVIGSGIVMLDPMTFEHIVCFNKKAEFVPAEDIKDKVRLINVNFNNSPYL